MEFKSLLSKIICSFIFIAMIQVQSGVQLMGSFTPFNNHSQNQSTNRQIEYTFIQSARGITNDGIDASFRTYESSDGMKIFTRIEFFLSAAATETQFKSKVESFSEMIEGSDIKDNNGKVIGERVVGKHYADEKGVEKYSIILSSKYKISYIESVSLNHILDFEKKVYKSQ